MCIDQHQPAMASRGLGLPTVLANAQLVATKVIASTTLRLLPERHMSAGSRDMIGAVMGLLSLKAADGQRFTVRSRPLTEGELAGLPRLEKRRHGDPSIHQVARG
jgi:hypothetical protein